MGDAAGAGVVNGPTVPGAEAPVSVGVDMDGRVAVGEGLGASVGVGLAVGIDVGVATALGLVWPRELAQEWR